MRISPFTLAALLSVGTTSAFVAPCLKQSRQTNLGASVVNEPNSASGRSKDEIASELNSGKVLEGGQVIDFEAVKGPSRAEQALLQARHALQNQHAVHHTTVPTAILGINNEVIQEVGHDLGTFANPETVQQCASYLRSMAPPGLFATTKNSDPTSFTAEQKAKFKQLIDKAYLESGEVTGAFAKTFYMGTQLLGEEARRAIWAIYVWCRRTDEIVDAPRDNDEDMLYDLSSWEMRLENLWKYGQVADVFDLCLLDVRVKYPALPITPFVDMIRGMLMDVPGLGQDRYDNFDELHLYCYRVAGTVGLMSMPIFGCAEGYTEEQAREPALSLGVAFQLTNILRDVGEDAVTRGRIYLPREDLERFGVTEDQIFEQRMDENYINMMKFQIKRARMYYERARRGVFMLAPESRLPVQSSLDAYGKILDKIEANGYDTLNYRAYVDKWEKLSIIPFSWYRTQEISKAFPLPGDTFTFQEA
jgi:phytoene synthase